MTCPLPSQPVHNMVPDVISCWSGLQINSLTAWWWSPPTQLCTGTDLVIFTCMSVASSGVPLHGLHIFPENCCRHSTEWLHVLYVFISSALTLCCPCSGSSQSWSLLLLGMIIVSTCPHFLWYSMNLSYQSFHFQMRSASYLLLSYMQFNNFQIEYIWVIDYFLRSILCSNMYDHRTSPGLHFPCNWSFQM